jgi:hypothetical protein
MERILPTIADLIAHAPPQTVFTRFIPLARRSRSLK